MEEPSNSAHLSYFGEVRDYSDFVIAGEKWHVRIYPGEFCSTIYRVEMSRRGPVFWPTAADVRNTENM